MVSQPAINLKSLREQVYDHLKGQIQSGALHSDEYLDLNKLAASLGVSRTPLRDALLQLEVEGFVTIAPRKGVLVRAVGSNDIREIYQMVGALESAALVAASSTVTAEDVARLKELNDKGRAAVNAGDAETYYQANYSFHDFFLDRCGNQRITKLVHAQKQHLYEWGRRLELDPAWEAMNLDEHDEIIRRLAEGDVQGAAAHLRDVHWNYNVQEPFVNHVYFHKE